MFGNVRSVVEYMSSKITEIMNGGAGELLGGENRGYISEVDVSWFGH